MDYMREIGMIFVVVATLVVIFFGIVAFLFFLERRVSNLEKNVNNE